MTSKGIQAPMVWIPGGRFVMGSDDHYPEEAPAHEVTVDGFWMDRHAVTNADYPGAQPEMLVPASVVFKKPRHRVDLRNHYNWWFYVPGADWRHPEGPGSSLKDRAKHPVVHLAHDDAVAYARWAGKAPKGRRMANTWHGEFPWQNLAPDGWERTAPVGSYPPNGYGLYDIIGNVWEWTTDWYAPRHEPPASCCGNVNPRGSARERSFDPQTPSVLMPRKVIKGGSFLCAANYCGRYRPAARMAQAVDTSTCHLGLRLILRTPQTPAELSAPPATALRSP